jgi:hypothetical protein
MQKRYEQPQALKVASKTHEDFNKISQLYHEILDLLRLCVIAHWLRASLPELGFLNPMPLH